MTQESLKALFTLDPQTSAFSPAGHNLAPDEAVERAGVLESEGKKVQIIDQPSRHRPLTFKRCKACTTAAENLSHKRPADPVEQENGGEQGTS